MNTKTKMHAYCIIRNVSSFVFTSKSQSQSKIICGSQISLALNTPLHVMMIMNCINLVYAAKHKYTSLQPSSGLHNSICTFIRLHCSALV